MAARHHADRPRHVIYTLIWIGVLTTLIWRVPTRMPPSHPTQALYDAIQRLPRNKLVILSVSWDVGTRGENGPQTADLIENLFMTDRKFAIFGWVAPAGPMLAEQIAERLARKYHKRYGVDWVNWGYKTGGAPMLQALPKDLTAIIREDIYHTPISKIPAMKGIRGYRNVSMVIELTGSATIEYWIQFWQGVYGTELGYGCTGVMAPEAFPYLDAGQIKGMLKGLVGAAEYETLLGVSGDGQQRMTSQSVAHVLIIALIILGNFVAFGVRRRS